MFRKSIFIPVSLSLLAFIILFVSAGSVYAQECRVARLLSTRGEIYIEPDVMFVQKDTCIIWTNWSKFSGLKVNFNEGDVCVKGTSAAVGFKYNEETNCYVTDSIPVGATASLAFQKEGTYGYTVEAADGTKQEGRIVVGSNGE